MRKRTLRIVTGLGVVIVLLGVLYAIAVGISAAKVRRAYAALEEAGRPMRTEEVIPPTVPDTQNAALLYESAYLLLKAQPLGEGNLLGRLGNWKKSKRETSDPNEPAETRRLLELDVVEQAVSMVKQGTLRPVFFETRRFLQPRPATQRKLGVFSKPSFDSQTHCDRSRFLFRNWCVSL